MNIKEYQSKMNNLVRDIKNLLSIGGFDYEHFENIEYPKNVDSADDWQIYNAMLKAAEHLDTAVDILEYYRLPIETEQTLYYDPSDGRYKCDYCTFTCGRGIEFYYYDEYDEIYKWEKSRVEYRDCEVYNSENERNHGYYIVGYNNVSLDGLKVRFR